MKLNTTRLLLLCSLVLITQGTYAQNKDDEHDYLKERKTKYRKGTHNHFKIDFGINNYLENNDFPDANNALYSVKPFGSWYVALNAINKTNVAGPLFVEWGGGFSWYNFKYENTDTRITKTNNGVVFDKDPRDINPIKSKLSASFINVSVVPLLDFGYSERTHNYWRFPDGDIEIDFRRKYGLRIGFGGYAGYRLGSHSKQVYSLNGDREKDRETSNFFINNIRYGLRAQLGAGRVDLFANYDLNELFSDNKGPKLNAFSFGFTLL